MIKINPYFCSYNSATRVGTESDLYSTKLYLEFSNALHIFFSKYQYLSCAETTVSIDIITNSTRNHKNLSSLINSIHESCNIPLPGECIGAIVIVDSSTFGTTVAERIRLYKKLMLSNIGLIVLDRDGNVRSELSTVELLELNFKSPTELIQCFQLWSCLSEPSRSGRRQKILKLDAGFIARYWCYEAYLLSEDFAVDGETSPNWYQSLLGRTISAGTWPKLSTRSFRQTCERYENSPEYQADFLYWSDFLRNKQIDLGNIPKRFGPLPKDFLEHVPGTSPADLDVARELLNKPQLTRAELHRLHLKATASRAEILNLCKRDVNYQLIKQIIFTSQMR